MFTIYKNYIILGTITILLGFLGFYYLKSATQEIELDKTKVQVEIVKDRIVTETFETKWDTIATEHNKSRQKATYEVKKPTTIDDTTIDFTFFGMFTAD